MLSIFAQNPFFFSPYIHYDIEKMHTISTKIKEINDQKQYGKDLILDERIKVIDYLNIELRKFIGIFLLYVEDWEIRRGEAIPNKYEYSKILAKLNNELEACDFLQKIILFLFDEMKKEYLVILHGELFSINKEGNTESDTIFSDFLRDLLKIKGGGVELEYSTKITDRITNSMKLNSIKDLESLSALAKNILNFPFNSQTTRDTLLTIVNNIKKAFKIPTEHDSVFRRYHPRSRRFRRYHPRGRGVLVPTKLFKISLMLKNAEIKSYNISGRTIQFVNGFLYEYIQVDIPYIPLGNLPWYVNGSSYQSLIYQNETIIKKFKIDNFSEVSHYFHLDSEIRVECPCPGCNTTFLMNEYGKINNLKTAILTSFELRRAKWLHMTASLHYIYRGATHTRLAHQIGTLMITVNSLNLINVYVADNFSIKLSEYLLTSDKMYEFMLANVLHDIGHAPMSHVLESNPYLNYNHEEVTRDLISGGNADKGTGHWYKTQTYLLRLNNINKFIEFFKLSHLTGDILDFIDKIPKVIDTDIVFIKQIIDNFGLNSHYIVDLLSEKYNDFYKEGDFSPKFSDVEFLRALFSSLQPVDQIFLNTLIESEIDFDRMDHIRRDSIMSGVSLSSCKLDDLLSSLTIVLPESCIHKKIFSNRINLPYIMISESGYKFFIDMLTTRQIIFKEVLYSEQNNWINGVINQITAFAVQYQPHMEKILPYITDQVVYHLFNNKMMNKFEVNKYYGILQGKQSSITFGEAWRFKLKSNYEKKITHETLRKIYKIFEDMNKKSNYNLFPRLILYTNIKPPKGEVVQETKEPELFPPWKAIFIYGKKFADRYYNLNILSKPNWSLYQYFRRPSEDDVKNLLYIWVNKLDVFNFIGCNPHEEGVIEELKKQIAETLHDMNPIIFVSATFDDYFDSIHPV